MRSIFSALLCAGCLWAAGCGRNATTTSAPAASTGDNPPKAKEPAFGVNNIDGRYKLTGAAYGGTWMPEAELAKETGVEVFKDGTWTTEGGKKASDGKRYKIDPSKSPAEIDIFAKYGDREVAQPAIYKVEGDVLTICNGGRERPKNFDVGPTVMILKFKRQ